MSMFDSKPNPLYSRPNGGLLISLEGCSGAGKTFTIKKILKEYNDIICISEVSDNNDKFVKDIITTMRRLNKKNDIFFLDATPIPTLFLLISLCIYNYENKIIPALAQNRLVIMDRGIDSPALLQSILHHFTNYNQDDVINMYIHIISIITSFIFPPDVTFIIDDDFEACIERTQQREQCPLNENELLFLQRVHSGFRAISSTANRLNLGNTNNIIHYIKTLILNHQKHGTVS